jgi:hypothetical protein
MISPWKNGARPTFADVLLLNGPGTCLMLCIAVYVNRVSLGNPDFATPIPLFQIVPRTACAQNYLC